MKTCTVCALDVEDTYSFCPEDGSSLHAVSGHSAADSLQSSQEVTETAGSLVLYCPTCAAEYPLTFTVCPTHGVGLTKHNISRPSQKSAPTSIDSEPAQADASNSSEAMKPDLAHHKQQAPERVIEIATVGSASGFHYPKNASLPFDREPNIGASDSEPANERFERPRFRIAAIATMIGLAVFALVAAFALLSNLSKRPPAPVARAIEASPPPFVPTPQEARDYAEPSPALSATKAAESRSDRPEPKASVPSSRPERIVSGPAADKSDRESRKPAPPTNVSTPSLPPLPRGDSGGFDARLIRVRSSKTSSGIRYDLTFNMQEQAGRGAQWQRVLITTQSASGANHSQAIPFAHRLGATGALTFTISVELAGRSEADWHGRVVCTTLGWDNQGAPLQARFGANLTP